MARVYPEKNVGSSSELSEEPPKNLSTANGFKAVHGSRGTITEVHGLTYGEVTRAGSAVLTVDRQTGQVHGL